MQRADGRVFTGRAGGPRLLQEGVQLDETRREAQHRTGTHDEWSARHLDKAGHAHHRRTGQAFSHPSTPPSHTTSGPSQPRSTSASQANATPAGTRSLAARNAIQLTSVTKPILRPPGNQIKSHLARLLRQAGTQAHAHMQAALLLLETGSRDWRAYSTCVHIYITRGYMQYSTSRYVH